MDNSNKKTNFFAKVLKFFDDILFPKYIKCVGCGKELKEKSVIEFCPDCLAKLEVISNDKCCERCGAKLVAEETFCSNCQSEERFFDCARSCFVYSAKVQHLIHQYKFGNKQFLSRVFIPFMVDKLKEMNWKIDIIMPVPMTKNRLKERGYNQALLLAKELSKTVNIDIDSTSLIKSMDTSHQVGLAYVERKRNLKDSFKVIDKMQVKDKNILLIDDVMTTGATASACAEALKKAKANKVYVLTIAHSVLKLPTISNDIDEKSAKSALNDIYFKKNAFK